MIDMYHQVCCRLVAVLAAVLATSEALCCTGFYAGRAVTTDGTVLIARTVDAAPWTSCHRFVSTPRVENAPGRVYGTTPDGFAWPLPATTHGFVSTPRLTSFGRGAMHSACANDAGVVISGTVTAHPVGALVKLDPYVADGAGENSLPGLLALSSGSARAALDLLAEVIAKRGHTGGEIYVLADRTEAWYVEVYTGHQWAAIRLPDDAVAGYGNQFMLGAFDPASPDSRHSPSLLALPERAGRLVRLDGGRIDLRRSYCAPPNDYSNYRTWFAHHVLAPKTAGDFATGRDYPLLFAPTKKVSLRDFFELMRARFEGTDHNPETTGRTDIRVIGTTKQSTCHAIALDPRLPDAFAGTVWATVAASEHGFFIPLNAAVTAHDAAYEADQVASAPYWNAGIAGYWFRRLATLAEQDRRLCGDGVRAFWRTREDAYLKDYPALLAAASRARDGRRRLTDWTVAAERRALADARAMTDELLWYRTAHNRMSGDGSGATDRPSAPFVPYARPHRTKVLFFFDTEDFTCDQSSDAIRDIANILHEEGVRGQFAMVCELGNFLVEKKRTDVIAALKHHLVGSQTLYHSKHPNIVEYGDVADYNVAYARTMREERLGFEILERTLGQKSNWCSVFPGNANSYVGLYVHSELGSRFFGGGNHSFVCGEREAVWFVNQFHLPYYKKLHLESFIPPKPMICIPERLDELARHDYVTLYMHPHMAVSKVHWDGPNFNPRDPVAWGQWRPTPKRDPQDVAVYYDRLRTFVKALKADSRFDVTDCAKLAASFRPRRTITRADVPRIHKSLEKRLAPIGASWSVADAFQGAVKLLRGENSHNPGRVYGFLEPPKGVTAPVTVSAADLQDAAKTIDLSTFLPAEIAVGHMKIGPADFLMAALEILETGAASVKIVPREQLGPIHELFPQLATYSMKGGWPLYEDTFEDRYLSARLRLQLWTLRYED